MEKKDNQKQNPYTKALALFLGAVCLLLCAVCACVYAVDPFFVYHAPLDNFPYVIDNQSAQNPGMARHMEYDAFLTGSSMTFNFDMDDFERELPAVIERLEQDPALYERMVKAQTSLFESTFSYPVITAHLLSLFAKDAGGGENA